MQGTAAQDEDGAFDDLEADEVQDLPGHAKRQQLKRLQQQPQVRGGDSRALRRSTDAAGGLPSPLSSARACT